MKLQYLGTAAAEGAPALFCDCAVCNAAWERGGKEIRTRSQALIDGELLIDFPADTFLHILREGIRLSRIRNCLITHTHGDHLYPTDIIMRTGGYAHPAEESALTFYGTPEAMKVITDRGKPSPRVAVCPLAPFTPTAVGHYTVTALPAHHAPDAFPYIYLISDGEKTLFYAHDTGPLFDEVWEYLAAHAGYLDLVSLDCTNGTKPMTYMTHMNLERNIAVRDRLVSLGLADGKTVFCCNHFSHNGGTPLYADFAPQAERAGFLTSYDGMTITV